MGPADRPGINGAAFCHEKVGYPRVKIQEIATRLFTVSLSLNSATTVQGGLVLWLMSYVHN